MVLKLRLNRNLYAGFAVGKPASDAYTKSMTIIEWVNAVIVALGLPAIIVVLVAIGRKLQVLDTLQSEVERNIRPDLKDVRERFATLEGKTAGLFQAQSPISLTEAGRRYLAHSGLQEFIDENQDDLMHQGEHDRKLESPYDVQQFAFEFFDQLTLPDDLENEVKTFAYNHGVSMDSMRRIGGIYFRDLCLQAHGFKSEDLD